MTMAVDLTAMNSGNVRDHAELTVRPATADDHALLYEIYASTRREQVAAYGWSAPQQDAFLRLQYHAQDRQLATQRLVVLADDEPIGRLYLDKTDDDVRIVDISLLPEARGRGYGTALLTIVLQESEAADLPVYLTVARDNPRAYQLYLRLGFQVTDEDPIYLKMSRRPAPTSLPLRRRSVVAAGAALAVTAPVAVAVSGLAAPAGAATSRTSGPLMRSTFTPYVGQGFTTGSTRLDLRAVADPPYTPAGLSPAALAAWRDANFVLTFEQVSGPALPADFVTLGHRRIGTFPVFLTPAEGRRYDALFNREVA